MGQSTRPKCAIVLWREIVLAKHQRARHRRQFERIGLIDPAANGRPKSVDPRQQASRSMLDRGHDDASGAQRAPESIRWARIAGRRVPESLRLPERRDDGKFVSASDVIRPAVESHSPLPRDDTALAVGLTDPRIPAQCPPHAYGRCEDGRVGGAAQGRSEETLGSGASDLVPNHLAMSTPRADGQCQGDRYDRGPRHAAASDRREENARAERNGFEGRDEPQASRCESAGRQAYGVQLPRCRAIHVRIPLGQADVVPMPPERDPLGETRGRWVAATLGGWPT